MHSNYRGMAFLLSLGSLPIACGNDDNETSGLGTLGPITTQPDNSSATAATGETGGTTTTGDDPTTNDVTTDDTNASASATNPSSATNQTTMPSTDPVTGDPATSDPVTGDPDSGASDPQMTTFVTGNTEDTGFPESESGGSSPYCQGYGDKVAECFGRDPMMVAEYCQYYIDQGLQMDGPGCAQALEAFYACVSQLDCNSFMMGTGCEQEDSGVMGACPSMGGP